MNNKMTNSFKKKNSFKQKKNKYYMNLPLIKRSNNNIRNKQINEARLEEHYKSKMSINDKFLYNSFEKNSKRIDKNILHSTINKISNFVDVSREIKNGKMRMKNNIYSKISNMSLFQDHKSNNSDSFNITKGGNTNRNHLIKKNGNGNYKDNFSFLTQRKQFINILNKQRLKNPSKEKNNSFHKYNQKNNLYFRLMENGKRKDYIQSRNIRYIYPNKNNNYLTTEVSNRSRKIIKDNQFMSDKREFKTFAKNSKSKEKKRIPQIIKKNYKNSKINNKKNLSISQSININKTYKDSVPMKTLVLDLDETLIFTSFQPSINTDLCFEIDLNNEDNNNSKLKHTRLNSLRKINNIMTKVYLSKRPYLEQFLLELYPFYEICIYSASSENYASSIIDIIDTKKVIKKRFFRNDCIHLNNSETFSYIKDLEKLEKNYNDIVIIDDNVSSFILQKENGIPIKSWRGDKKDIELLKLIPILKNLSGFYDVRTEIKQFVINKTFIWIQGINWLFNNCLSYSYINEIIKIMEFDQIPIADKLLYYFTEGKFYNNINFNESYIDNNYNYNNMSVNQMSLKQKNNGNFTIHKGNKSYEKRKRGKSANFNNTINDSNNNNKHICNLKFSINEKLRQRLKISNQIFNRRKSRSKSAFQNKDFENDKCFTNKIMESLRKKKLKIKNINIYPFSNNNNIKRRGKNSYSISYS